MQSLEEFELIPLREFTSYREAHLKLSRYLLGYNVPSVGRLADPREERLPLLDSSLSTHIREVDRFLFNGGIQVDISGARADDPRQLLINSVLKANGLSSLLGQMWWNGAVYGELALCFTRGAGRNLYPIGFYTPDEYLPVYDENRELAAIAVYLVREVNRKRLVFRQWVDRERIVSYPLVDERQARGFEWSSARNEQAHGWGLVPGAIVVNIKETSSLRGVPEFNQGALDLASELAIAYLDSASNHHQFANPIYVSPDPVATLKALRDRLQVLQKEAPEDGGDPQILAPQGMPASHFELIDRLERSLANALGRSHGNQDAPPDTSSLTLRMLNAKTISLAEERWQSYVNEGLLPLLNKVLIAAGVDGVIAGVSAATEAKLEARRLKPYFTPSPQERSQQLAVSSELVSLGVRREVALREVFPDLTDEQILDLLEGD